MVKSKHIGSTLNSFLEEEGLIDEVEEMAVKKVIANQLQQLLKEKKITKTELAKRLDTARAAVDRLLDPRNESITLNTLKRAAGVLGKRLRLEMV